MKIKGVTMLTEKPLPDSLALAFQECKPGQSRHELELEGPGLAYGLRPGLTAY